MVSVTYLQNLSGVIAAFDKQMMLQIDTLNFIVTGLWSS